VCVFVRSRMAPIWVQMAEAKLCAPRIEEPCESAGETRNGCNERIFGGQEGLDSRPEDGAEMNRNF